MFIPDDWGKDDSGQSKYRDIPISKYVKLARERHLEDLWRAHRKDPDFPYYYDSEDADHAVWFFQNNLHHFDGEWYGEPFKLSDWQEFDIIRPLFGWKNLDGSRRFRTAYIEIPRRNGKSFLSAGLALYLLCGDCEFGAQVYSAATKEEQAKLVFDAALKMVKLSPELSEELEYKNGVLYNEFLWSKYKPLGRDSKTQDGFSVHGGVIDEYHAHKTPDMLNVLRSGRGSRRQPLIVIITTAGYGVETPCKKESDFAKKLLSGILKNESYFAYITTVDNESLFEDPLKLKELKEKNPDELYAEFQRANPNLGISIYKDGFLKEFDEAYQQPDKWAEFKCKNLNIWSSSITKWISMALYAKCDGEIDWDQFRGQPCWCALDLGISRDVSAFAMAFRGPPKYDAAGELLPFDIYLKVIYWVPEIGIEERYKTDGVNYPEWRDAGWIRATAGLTTRYDVIRRDINKLAEEFEIKEIAVDPAHGYELMQHLADDNFTVVKHSQGFYAMNTPCVSTEELIANQRFRHGNDPVLRWMVSNTSIVRNAYEDIKITKEHSGDRVDGFNAVVMAVGRILIAPEDAFVYNTQGMYIG